MRRFLIRFAAILSALCMCTALCPQAAFASADPTVVMTNATADAMRTAAANESGAMNGFIGMGMANGLGGNAAANMFAQAGPAQQQQSAYPMASGGGFGGQRQPAGQQPAGQPAAGGWVCPQCGNQNTANFCGNCGTPKPAPATWFCTQCGNENTGNFCGNCGTPRQ